MQIKSILVVTDLSLRENLAVQRACSLAAAHGAWLKLMYVPASGRPPYRDAANRLANTARQLEEVLELRVRTIATRAGSLEEVAREARGCDLLVLAQRRDTSWRGRLFGQPLQRLLRSCRTPVLVARAIPQERYGRIVVALDSTPASRTLIGVAAALEPEAAIEPVRTLRRSGADLVLVGQDRAPGWKGWLRRSALQRALASGAADVLVVPPGLAPSPRSAARQRGAGDSLSHATAGRRGHAGDAADHEVRHAG